jgi:hypothetical protein
MSRRTSVIIWHRAAARQHHLHRRINALGRARGAGGFVAMMREDTQPVAVRARWFSDPHAGNVLLQPPIVLKCWIRLMRAGRPGRIGRRRPTR